MSTPGPLPIAPVPDPELPDLLRASLRSALERLNCHQWATLVAFDPATQKATVSIAALRQVIDYKQNPPARVSKQYPLLLDVPVVLATGGDGGVTFPIRAGDVCLLLFNDRDFDLFWETANPVLPNTARIHDLSDAVALIGPRTKPNPLAGYDPDRTVLFKGETKVALGDKIEISNASTSLLTVLSNLITTLKGFTDTHGDTPNAATITALNSNQSSIDSLLQ